MYYVYLLQSLKDKRTYVGYTKNLEERLERHNSGGVVATRYRRPLTFLFVEGFATIQEAKKRELWWKSGAGRRELKRFFKKRQK